MSVVEKYSSMSLRDLRELITQQQQSTTSLLSRSEFDNLMDTYVWKVGAVTDRKAAFEDMLDEEVPYGSDLRGLRDLEWIRSDKYDCSSIAVFALTSPHFSDMISVERESDGRRLYRISVDEVLAELSAGPYKDHDTIFLVEEDSVLTEVSMGYAHFLMQVDRGYYGPNLKDLADADERW